MNSLLLTLIPLCTVAAVPLVLLAARVNRTAAAWTCAGVMFVGLLLLAVLAREVMAGNAIVAQHVWLPALELHLSLRLDGLGLLFAILILGIGMLIVLYAAYYFPAEERLGRFYAQLLVFAGAMLGVVLAENLLLLLICWEATSIASFLLIAYKHHLHDGRIAARMALAVTGGGGLMLLAAILLLGHIAGSFELTDILARGDQVRAHPLYAPMLVLVLLSAFTKSAQFPFHFWLPNAMAAPTPVSAYLHSATMVKAGVFLLARLYPVLSETDLWFVLVSTTGAVTLIYGASVALLKDDFKSLLAYSTISHLGLITLLLGLDTPMSAVAAVFHIANHAIFKASLFMSAGIIDHEYGTRDMRRISGLFKYMPWTSTLGIVAAGSMAGVPLLNGFLSKEMFFSEAVGHPGFEGYAVILLPVFATLAGALSVAYSARFVHGVFFGGEPVNLPRPPHRAPRWMRVPVEILVGLCLAVGLFPKFTVGILLDAATVPLLPRGRPEYELAIWHGFNLPLAMSMLALCLGLLYYSRRRHIFALRDRYGGRLVSPVIFDRLMGAAGRIAARLIGMLDNGSLHRHLVLLLLAALGLGGWAYFSAAPSPLSGPLHGTTPDLVVVLGFVALLIGSIGTVVHHRSRLTAIVFMSVVGLVMSLAFIRFSAPDLALTQLSVEVVTIVLLLLALRFLPLETPPECRRSRQWRDLGLALLGGGGIAALSYALLTRPFETLSRFYIDNALPEGGGRNVVNVILVDFRGFDTLGEISVLTMAALGVCALVERLDLAAEYRMPTSTAARSPLMLEMLMRPLLPLALTVSVFVLLRGHNLPGGGFIAGLIAAVALLMQYLASGQQLTRARLRLDHIRLLALGLGLAAATGAASWLFGHPFLTSAFGHWRMPGIGELELASAMAFDIGVYLVVIGSVLLVLSEIGGLGRDPAAPPPDTRRPHREATWS